jgi:HSP20 family protein
MAMVRWDPLRDFEHLSSRLSQLLGETRAGDDNATLFKWSPAVDVAEDDKEYLVKADLPDVKKEDVKINIQDGVLVVEGERKQEKEEKGKKFHRIERSYGKFVRQLGVPSDVDAAKVSAEYTDGVLRVHLPKAASAKSASIDVKVM